MLHQKAGRDETMIMMGYARMISDVVRSMIRSGGWGFHNISGIRLALWRLSPCLTKDLLHTSSSSESAFTNGYASIRGPRGVSPNSSGLTQSPVKAARQLSMHT